MTKTQNSKLKPALQVKRKRPPAARNHAAPAHKMTHKLEPVAPEQLREFAKLMHPAFCHSLGYCLVKSGFILRALLDQALSDCQMISPQFAILAILAESGSMSQIEIGTVLGVDKATMVKLIDGLEKHKCVTRVSDKVDRRVKQVQITAVGRRFRERGLDVRNSLEKEVLSNLSASEQAQLLVLMPKLLDQLRAMAMK